VGGEEQEVKDRGGGREEGGVFYLNNDIYRAVCVLIIKIIELFMF
jgi:hypothetical protein